MRNWGIYIHRHSYHANRGRKGETEIGYRDIWNSTTATLVLLPVRSKTPIHRTDILRPHLMDEARKFLYCEGHIALSVVAGLEPGTPSS